MWKLRIGALVTSGAFALGLSSGAWADGGAGGVWLGTAGAPPAHTSDSQISTDGTTTATAGVVNTASVTTTWIAGVETSIGAVTASRHKAHKLVRSNRHRKVQKRHVKAVSVGVPTVTG